MIRMRLVIKSLAKRVLTILVIVYFLSCLRIFLPTPIRHTDVLHLARLAVEWQRFPIHQDDAILNTVNYTVPVFVHPAGIKQFEQTNSWKRLYVNDVAVNKQFRPSMTHFEYQQMLLTFTTFIDACKWANLTYSLTGGSLLGSYRHHGFIPWDDDVDVVMNASDWRRIRHVLSRVPGFQLYAPSDVQWKFFLKDLPAIPNKHFKWPNIDIFFFTEDSTYIWGLTADIKGTVFSKKSDYFPLQLRPFENVLAVVPCNAETLISEEFGFDECVSLAYGHKSSTWMTDMISQPCDKLHAWFPFVFKSRNADGTIREILKMGDQIIRNITITPSKCGI